MRVRAVTAWFVTAAIALVSVNSARGVTPESPEVRAALKKAFGFLDTARENRLGGKCLIGLAYLKDGADEQHAKVVDAIKACQNVTRGEAAAINSDIYSTGIAIIFLCSVNPSKYQTEILKLRDSLHTRQKSHGGWGYAERPTGDTSMTQYGLLSYWEMSTAGLPINIESTERVANWLLRTQDPTGNWGYQGRESEDGKLVKQDSARPGMAAAGLGCTYIAADILNLIEMRLDQGGDLPPAVRRLGKAPAALSTKVDARQLRAAQQRGKDWFSKNFRIDPPGFTHYYLYALERYQSFAEAADGKVIKEPRWYSDGFAYLKRTQEASGSWKGEQENLEAVNTAFGALFLLRSTKKAIERSKTYGDGSLLAGRGLPQNVQEVSLRAGQIVTRPARASAKDAIEILARPSDPGFASVAADAVWIRDRLLETGEQERGALLVRLRELAIRGVPDARRAAARTLGLVRDMDGCAALIQALSDSDWQVVLAADEALRRIARQSAPATLGEKSNGQAQAAAIAGWKQWYLAIRPDAEFEN